MKKFLALLLVSLFFILMMMLMSGCVNMPHKRYKIEYSPGKHSRYIYTNSYIIDENGCLHVNDEGYIGGCGCGEPDIVCGDFTITDRGEQGEYSTIVN